MDESRHPLVPGVPGLGDLRVTADRQHRVPDCLPATVTPRLTARKRMRFNRHCQIAVINVSRYNVVRPRPSNDPFTLARSDTPAMTE